MMTTFQQFLFGGSPSKLAAKPGKRIYRSRAVAASTPNWLPILIPGALLDMDMFQVHKGKSNLSVKVMCRGVLKTLWPFPARAGSMPTCACFSANKMVVFLLKGRLASKSAYSDDLGLGCVAFAEASPIQHALITFLPKLKLSLT